MSLRLPRAASSTAPASFPPAGLHGLDPAFSRLVEVPGRAAGGVVRVWHVLDNGPELAQLGIRPVGTILCVHGNPTWSYLWRALVAETTAQALTGETAWRVIAVDQLEMGFSERTGERRPLARRVDDLGDFTEAIGLDGPVVTFGHDWGGVISLGWAVRHRSQLSGVMLLNTAVHQPENESIPALLRLALWRPVLGTATVSTSAFLESTLALAHPPLPAGVKAAYRAPYVGSQRRGGIGGFVADIPADDAHESTAELDVIATGIRDLDVPTLMIWGPRDPIFSDRYLDDLAERMPRADIHRFETAGHLIAEDSDYSGVALEWLATQRLAQGDERPGEPGPSREAEAGEVSEAARPLWQYLDDLAASDEPALIEMAPATGRGVRVVSWRLLALQVRQLAGGLAEIGVKPGDRVSLLIPPGADLTATLYACLRIGAVVVVADAGLGLRGLTRAVRGTWPDYVIGARPGLSVARALGWPGRRISTLRLSAALAKTLGVSHSLPELVALGRARIADAAAAPPTPTSVTPPWPTTPLPTPPMPGDTAAILFTSGSTGPAKGVVYTHAQLASVRDALAAQYDIGVGTGLVAGFAPFALLGPALGARSVTPDMNVTSPKTLTARAVAEATEAADATVVFLSPAALANVSATSIELTPRDRSALARVRLFLSAGAPVSEGLLSDATLLMPNAQAHTPYGMTEGLLVTDITLEGIRAADSAADAAGGVCVGLPGPSTRVRISALDADGYATGAPTDEPGVTGEILASAAHIEDHYHRLWATDHAARRDSADGERWHRTGDVGHLDAAGRLWVEGRVQHVMVTASGVITPVGLEQRIELLPGVRRAAVVGVGPRGIQQLVAVVETDPAARRLRLASFDFANTVRAQVESPLAAVLIVPRLPTDIRHNSKIDRTLLARSAGSILAGGRMVLR